MRRELEVAWEIAKIPFIVANNLITAWDEKDSADLKAQEANLPRVEQFNLVPDEELTPDEYSERQRILIRRMYESMLNTAVNGPKAFP